MAYNLGYVGTGYNAGYAGAFTAGPSLTAPAALVEGDTATITLVGNLAAPTQARLNGTVVILTDIGAGSFTFLAPRLPDDATATFAVDVDGFTKTTTLAYTNLFPYANTQHGEPDPLSVLYSANFATTQPYEIRVASDTDSLVMAVDWAGIDAAGAWLDDVTPYITMASGVEYGQADVTLDFYRHETGDVQSRTVTINNLGPKGVVTIDSLNASRNAATITFSYDRSDLTGYEYTLDGGATLVPTSNPAELVTLTSATPYAFWIRAINLEGVGSWTKTTFTTAASVDTSPDAFPFTAQTNLARGVTATSNAITVTGVDAGVDVPISVAGDLGSQYSVSTNGTDYGGWTATATTVRLNYRVRVRHTTSTSYSSGGYNGVRETQLTIGGVTHTFRSTTLADFVAPVISLTGGNLNWTQGTPWVEPGYEAIDNADGDISVSGVVITGSINPAVLGPQTLTYTATDASGNSASTTRTVTVVIAAVQDAVKPVITLAGGNQTLTAGDAWVEPGFSASDNLDGNITEFVQISGAVNTAQAGVYSITYSVTDQAGNTGTAVRTVTVVALVQYPMDILAPVYRTINPEFTAFGGVANEAFMKAPREVLDFDIELTDWIAGEADSIDPQELALSVEVDVAGLEILDSGYNATEDRIKLWCGGGRDGANYTVSVFLTTQSGRRKKFIVRLVTRALW